MTAYRKTVHLVKRTKATVSFKKNVRTLLPYNRNRYISYLRSDISSHTDWYGVSFQLASEEQKIRKGISIDSEKYINTYFYLFNRLISKFDDGSYWIVTHDKYDDMWLPNAQQTLPQLRSLFAQYHVPNAFKGAILLTKQELFTITRDIISYPWGIFSREGSLYSDIDVSHSKLPFLIKISSHQNIDVLSTDKALLQEVVNENRSPVFTVKQYTGTSL